MKEYFLGSYRRSSGCFDVLWNSFWWFVLKVLVNADTKILLYSVLAFGVLLIGSLLHQGSNYISNMHCFEARTRPAGSTGNRSCVRYNAS